MRILPIITMATAVILMFPMAQALPQQLIMDVEVDKNPGEKNSGPNKLNYWETRIFYGIMPGIGNPQFPVKIPASGEFDFLLRYKLKIIPVLSTGIGTGYNSQNFRVSQDGKQFPDNQIYDKEAFRLQSFKSSVFLRLNIDPKRGNFLGKYLETGLTGSWSYNLRRIIILNYSEGDGIDFSRSREIQRGLNYLNKIQYGAYVSIGINNLELSYRMRFSEIIPKENYSLDFPKHIIGLSYGLNLIGR